MNIPLTHESLCSMTIADDCYDYVYTIHKPTSAMVDEEGSIKFEELSTEQQERAKACKTPDELLALAQQEGMELTDDDLAMVSGGWGIERDDMQGDDGCGRRFSQM